MSRTCSQQCIAVMEVAAYWHDLIEPQHIIQSSIASSNKQLDPWPSQQTSLPQTSTLGLHPITCELLVISCPTGVGG